MKKYFLYAYMSVFTIIAVAQNVITVTEPGEGGDYNTLAEAVTAASAGDIISVVPLTDDRLYQEDSTIIINKSLTIMSSESTDRAKFSMLSLSIEGAPDSSVVNIINVDLNRTQNLGGVISANDHEITSNRVYVNLTYVDYWLSLLDRKNITSNIAFCTSTYQTKISSGNLVGSKLKVVYIEQEPEGSLIPYSEVIRIIGNEFENCRIKTRTHSVDVRNNYFQTDGGASLDISTVKDNSSNYYVNNTFGHVDVSSNTNGIRFSYHIENDYTYGPRSDWEPASDDKHYIQNNLFHLGNDQVYLNYDVAVPDGVYFNTKLIMGYNFHSPESDWEEGKYHMADIRFWPNDLPTYTYDQLEVTVPSDSAHTDLGTYVDLETGDSPGLGIDSGNPSKSYYDADLTRSDIGCNGGSMAYSVYRQIRESADGRPVVSILDAPSIINDGQTIDIKVTGVDY